ncbi:MAG: PIN domain-containing protein [Candidatus Saccharimonadales bacterium]
MKLLVDTSAFSVFGRGGDNRLDPWFTSQHSLLMPLIVIGELRAGFAMGGRETDNVKRLERFLEAPNVEVVKLSQQTTRLYADVVRQLRQAGRAASSNDIWIAALAVEHHLPLLTLDRDFAAITGLQLVPLGK